MYLIPFHRVEPGLAADETRFMQLFDKRGGLPAGRYDLVEHYCPDPDCDCRRVMLTGCPESVCQSDREASGRHGFQQAGDRRGSGSASIVALCCILQPNGVQSVRR